MLLKSIVFEPVDRCKAHLVRLTADVQIRSTLLVGINCAKRIKGTCKNYTGKLNENQSGHEQVRVSFYLAGISEDC